MKKRRQREALHLITTSSVIKKKYLKQGYGGRGEGDLINDHVN